MLTADQLESWEAYKFVRVNGQYRFLHLGLHCDTHKSLVQPGETAESAGTISLISDDEWKFLDTFSTSLKVGVKEDDEERLLGRSPKREW